MIRIFYDACVERARERRGRGRAWTTTKTTDDEDDDDATPMMGGWVGWDDARPMTTRDASRAVRGGYGYL